MSSINLPTEFKALFWSQDYKTLDLNLDKKTIIVNTINYGDLSHWKWIKSFYGDDIIKEILIKISYTELRDRVRPLAELIFSISNFNHAPRSTN